VARERKARAARKKWLFRGGAVAGVLLVLGGLGAALVSSGWQPNAPFDHNAPEVDEAIRALDAGALDQAATLLEGYLGTGVCAAEGFGVPDRVREKSGASFDLGLVLFALGERFGQPFGEEPPATQGDDGQGADPASVQRSQQIDCALLVVRAIADEPKVPIELRARAQYLAGNLEFLRGKYEDAVRYYDQALTLIPGVPEDAGTDGIGRDAAHNRAIALRRIEDEKDAGPDAEPPDASPDADDGGDDGGQDASPDGGDGGDEGDAGDDGGGADAGQDGGEADGGDSQQPPPEAQRPEPQPPEEMRDDERMLEQLEEAPTYQEQEAKNRARGRRGREMEDK
jgi:tetratricopeptide (TPR) repeat protein